MEWRPLQRRSARPVGRPPKKPVVFNAPEGGVLRAWIDRSDALSADNEAYAIPERVEAAEVLLVTPAKDAFFFEQVLVAMEPLVDPHASRTLTVVEYDALPPTSSPPDLTIFNNCVPQNMPASGQFVLVNGWPAEIPAKVIGTLSQPELSLARRDHPLTRYLSFSAVNLARAKELDLAERATILARSSAGTPLIFLYEQPGRQVLCLAFEVLESDLPFRHAFPSFSAMRWPISFLSRPPGSGINTALAT